MKEGALLGERCQVCIERFVVCVLKTDLFCVACGKWICRVHVTSCVQCRQPVCCTDCEDFCCLIRPWGARTERYLKDCYENKLLYASDMLELAYRVEAGKFSGLRRCNNYRLDAGRRSVQFVFDKFDSDSILLLGAETFRYLNYVPEIAQYTKEEEMRSKFISFMKSISSSCLLEILIQSNERDDILSLLHDFLVKNSEVLSFVFHYSLKMERGRALFQCLQKRNLVHRFSLHNPFPPDTFRRNDVRFGHLDGFLWCGEKPENLIRSRKLNPNVLRYEPFFCAITFFSSILFLCIQLSSA